MSGCRMYCPIRALPANWMKGEDMLRLLSGVVIVITLGLMAALVFLFPGASPQAAVGTAPSSCTIVVTGDTRAALEDCG